MREQRSLFQPKRKAPAAAATTSWSHRVPTNQSAKLLLEEEALLAAYPRLHRCKAQSRELLLISPRISNGKVYNRPIQRDLSLEPEEEDEDIEGVSVF